MIAQLMIFLTILLLFDLTVAAVYECLRVFMCVCVFSDRFCSYFLPNVNI